MDASVSAASDDRVGHVHGLQELTRPQSPLPPFRRCSSSTSRKGVIVGCTICLTSSKEDATCC